MERFRAGELNELLVKEPFKNVIFAESQRLEKLSERVDKAARQFSDEANSQSPQSECQSPVVKKSTSSAMPQSPRTSRQLRRVVLVTIAHQPICRTEVNRLRSELEYRSQLADSLRSFLERISSA